MILSITSETGINTPVNVSKQFQNFFFVINLIFSMRFAMLKTRGSFLLLNMILIISGALLGFNVYERFHSSRTFDDAAPASSHPVIAEPAQPGNHPLSYYQSIIDRDLFKTRSESRTLPKPLNPEVLPQTDLALKLWGTAIGDHEASYAVIQDTKQIGKKRQHILYKTGDFIRNAKLAKIYRDKVVLKIEGKNEVLKIEQFRSRSLGRYRPTQARRLKRLRARVVRRANLKKVINVAKRLSADNQFRQHQEGIYLYRINRNPALRRLGLRNRDLITAINGHSVHAVNEIGEIYDLIQSRRRFNLEIKRRGRPTTIKYFIK
jgi:general secretion pathway protein C